VWRCLGQFDRLALPAATIVDTALVDHALELVAACLRHDDELVGHPVLRRATSQRQDARRGGSARASLKLPERL
jgi:hypothetical protein